jgi:uncharacterized membrane protein
MKRVTEEVMGPESVTVVELTIYETEMGQVMLALGLWLLIIGFPLTVVGKIIWRREDWHIKHGATLIALLTAGIVSIILGLITLGALVAVDLVPFCGL